jgi:hypothetical protein
MRDAQTLLGLIRERGRKGATLDDQPPKLWTGRTELLQRLLAEFCELCGRNENIEVHHVQAMRKLHEHPGRSKPEWVKRMIALQRKTLILCRDCHVAIEHGLPLKHPVVSLTEVKARRQQVKITQLESRVH